MSRCSVCRLFESNRQDLTFEYLERYLNNAKVGMNKAKYLEVCSLFGDEPDMDKMPPDMEDFPTYVIHALNIFNSLPDMYTGGMEPIYCGKDLGSLQVLLDLYEVPKEEKMLCFDIIRFIDNRARTHAMDKAKRKGK